MTRPSPADLAAQKAVAIFSLAAVVALTALAAYLWAATLGEAYVLGFMVGVGTVALLRWAKREGLIR